MRNSEGASWHRSQDFLAAFHHGSWAVLGEISNVNLHLVGSLELRIWFLIITLFLHVVSPILSPGFPRVLSEELMDPSKGFHLVSGLLTADLVWYWALWHLCWSSEIYENKTRRRLEMELFVICFVVTCYKKNSSMLDDTGHSLTRERFFIWLSCYFNLSWCTPSLLTQQKKIILWCNSTVCITTMKETKETQSLTLPQRNEYASCVNLPFKITVEARLTQSKVLCTGLLLPKIVLLTA